MEDKDPDEKQMKDFEKFFQNRKAVAGIVLLLASTFGLLAFMGGIRTDVTGFFLAEEVPEDNLVMDLEETIEKYNDIYEDDEAMERAIEHWAIKNLAKNYNEEDLREALEAADKDPGFVYNLTDE